MQGAIGVELGVRVVRRAEPGRETGGQREGGGVVGGGGERLAVAERVVPVRVQVALASLQRRVVAGQVVERVHGDVSRELDAVVWRAQSAGQLALFSKPLAVDGVVLDAPFAAVHSLMCKKRGRRQEHRNRVQISGTR